MPVSDRRICLAFTVGDGVRSASAPLVVTVSVGDGNRAQSVSIDDADFAAFINEPDVAALKSSGIFHHHALGITVDLRKKNNMHAFLCSKEVLAALLDGAIAFSIRATPQHLPLGSHSSIALAARDIAAAEASRAAAAGRQKKRKRYNFSKTVDESPRIARLQKLLTDTHAALNVRPFIGFVFLVVTLTKYNRPL